MPAFRLCLIALVLLGIAGCAGAPSARPAAPDLSALAPAERAFAQARAAHAGQFAPRALDAARRRITTARDILYRAAGQRRSLTEVERERVAQLVQAAELDARSALVQTQAKAVMAKLGELRGALNTGARGATGAMQ